MLLAAAFAVLITGCSNGNSGGGGNPSGDGGKLSESVAKSIFEYEIRNGGVVITKFKSAQALNGYLSDENRAASGKGKKRTLTLKEINGLPVIGVEEKAFTPSVAGADDDLAGADVQQVALPAAQDIDGNAFADVTVDNFVVSLPETTWEKADGTTQGALLDSAQIQQIGSSAVADGFSVNNNEYGFTLSIRTDKIPAWCDSISIIRNGWWMTPVYRDGAWGNETLELPCFPFVKAGEVYTFQLWYAKTSDQNQFSEKSASVTVKATGGLGELIVTNNDELSLSYDATNHTISLSGTPKVPELKGAGEEKLTGKYYEYDISTVADVPGWAAVLKENPTDKVNVLTDYNDSLGDFLALFSEQAVYVHFYYSVDYDGTHYNSSFIGEDVGLYFIFPKTKSTISGTAAVTVNGVAFSGAKVKAEWPGQKTWPEAVIGADGRWSLDIPAFFDVAKSITLYVQTAGSWVDSSTNQTVTVNTGVGEYPNISFGTVNHTGVLLKGTISAITFDGQPLLAWDGANIAIEVEAGGSWKTFAPIEPQNQNNAWALLLPSHATNTQAKLYVELWKNNHHYLKLAQTVPVNMSNLTTISGISIGAVNLTAADMIE